MLPSGLRVLHAMGGGAEGRGGDRGRGEGLGGAGAGPVEAAWPGAAGSFPPPVAFCITMVVAVAVLCSSL